MKGLVFKALCLVALIAGVLHGKRDHDAKQRARDLQIQQIREEQERKQKEREEAAKAKPEVLIVDITDDINRARALLEKAAFDETERILERAIARKPGAADREKAEEILAEIALFRRLTARIPDHPFRDGQDLYRVVLASGKRFIARIKDPKAEFLELETADGVRLKVRKARARSVERLSAEDHRKEVLAELDSRVAELGREANPVELYRIAVYYCMEFGLRERALGFLRKALVQPSGGVLIDLFCEGDTRIDRRTQARMAGLTDFSQLAMVTRPDPREVRLPGLDPVKPARPKPVEPRPVTPVEPLTPKPPPEPARPQGPKVTQERLWIEAEEGYQKGLRVYRDSLRGTAERTNKLIKLARQYFERAQETLIKLAERYDSDRLLDQRIVEIQQLVYDCIKRQKV